MRKLPGRSYDSIVSKNGQGERIISGTRNAVVISGGRERKKRIKLVNRGGSAAAGSEGSRGKNNHARRRAQFGARNLYTGRVQTLLTNAKAVIVTRRTHLMCLRVHYAPRPTVLRGPGTIAFCGRGKAYLHTCGIIQFAMHRTYTSSRDRAVYATAWLANARDYHVHYAALRFAA